MNKNLFKTTFCGLKNFCKKIKIILSLGVLTMIFIFTGGFDNYYHEEYIPVLLSRTELEKSIKFLNAREIDIPGKIYIKDSIVFISEKYKGIHIINNKDSLNPKNIGFINIPGCIDMAVKGQYLYADNAVDLVTIDLSDLPTITVTNRNIEIFPEIPNPQTNNIPDNFSKSKRPANTVIVNWIKKENTY